MKDLGFASPTYICLILLPKSTNKALEKAIHKIAYLWIELHNVSWKRISTNRSLIDKEDYPQLEYVKYLFATISYPGNAYNGKHRVALQMARPFTWSCCRI